MMGVALFGLFPPQAFAKKCDAQTLNNIVDDGQIIWMFTIMRKGLKV